MYDIFSLVKSRAKDGISNVICREFFKCWKKNIDM